MTSLMSDIDVEIDIRPVDFETRAHFSHILEEASAWQKARGSEGWSYPFDDAWMLPRIERGELFLAYMDSQAVAAFRILWEDRPYWGEKETGDSIYLHTFAVRRDKAGDGIGKTVIEKIAGMGRERGLANIRLDCSLSSSKLIAYYEQNGFASVGTTFMNGKMMNLMERPL